MPFHSEPLTPDRRCLTCKRPLSEHKGFKCPDDDSPASEANADPLKPAPALLCKLGSLIYHLEEAMDSGGHEFDIAAAKQLREDADVEEWFGGIRDLAMLPVKR